MHTPDDLSDLVQRLQQPEPQDAAPTESEPLPQAAPDELRRRPARRAQQRRRRTALIVAAAALVLALGGGGAAWAVIAGSGDEVAAADKAAEKPEQPKPETTPAPDPEPDPEPEPEPEPAPQYELDDPNAYTVVVNKQRPLVPIDWAPGDLRMPEGIPNANGQPLRDEAATALEQMHAESSAAGLSFTIASAYRDYGLQTSLFESYSASDGVEAAETYSARPGHSEHQLGLAVDIVECQGCGLSEAFGETEVGLWARENAHRFGFILRYDQGEQPVVGYVYEPWHFRYVGVEVATDMKNTGVKNLEDYFGLPAAPTY